MALEKLASSLGREDDEPNVDLAIALAKGKDHKGIREIAEGLKDPDARVAADCLKVLYEIGYREPGMISGYAEDFIRLLESRSNRMVWGAMIALGCIAHLVPKDIWDNLDAVIRAYEKGSVITVDNCISVFAGLALADPEYEKKSFPLIIKHLETCRPKEVGQHAERAFPCVNEGNAALFARTLEKRRDALAASQKKRVDKLLKKIEEGEFGSPGA